MSYPSHTIENVQHYVKVPCISVFEPVQGADDLFAATHRLCQKLNERIGQVDEKGRSIKFEFYRDFIFCIKFPMTVQIGENEFRTDDYHINVAFFRRKDGKTFSRNNFIIALREYFRYQHFDNFIIEFFGHGTRRENRTYYYHLQVLFSRNNQNIIDYVSKYHNLSHAGFTTKNICYPPTINCNRTNEQGETYRYYDKIVSFLGLLAEETNCEDAIRKYKEHYPELQSLFQ